VGGLEAAAFGDYPQVILGYLNRGASGEGLDAALADAGVGNVPLAVVPEDLTGDGFDDLVVSIFNPRSEAVIPPGMALIYVCEGGQYNLAYGENSQPGFSAPHIWYVQDLDADGAAEVVLSQATCGAHTCFDDVEVLSWDGSAFSNRLGGETLDLPYPDVRVEDADGDGVFDLSVLAGGIASVGAGPQRDVTRQWTFDRESSGWIAREDILGPAKFRIHILHDAETAMREGNLVEALGLFERVITDPTLEEWMDPETERANLAAYARFKQVVVYTLESQVDFAEIIMRELQAAYPAGSPQRKYVTLAEAFWAGWEVGGVAGGCEMAEEYAVEQAEAVLTPLGPLVFGYANPEINLDDICPME
jgi:hypothetical protein